MLAGLTEGGGGEALQMIDSTTVRAHPCAAGARGGTQNQALGRSRGGFSTKIHLRANAEGLPVAVLLTPGEAHDCTAYPDLMAEHDVDPEVLLADRGYDSDVIREDIRSRGGEPQIPTKKDRALYAEPAPFDRTPLIG